MLTYMLILRLYSKWNDINFQGISKTIKVSANEIQHSATCYLKWYIIILTYLILNSRYAPEYKEQVCMPLLIKNRYDSSLTPVLPSGCRF